MDLTKVMAISGKSGLFKIISQSRASIIVESFADGKKMPVFAHHRSSVLEDISMFTYTEDIPLKNVIWSIYQKEEGKPVSIDLKSDNETLKAYFEEVLPDFDQDRVYASDIKKVLAWYNQLLEQDMISEPVEEEEEKPEEETQKEEKEAAAEEKAPEEKKEAKEKKPAAKKPAATKKKTPAKGKAGEKKDDKE